MAEAPEKPSHDESLPTTRWERHLVVIKRATIWQPPTDAYETPDHFAVIVELAGMREGDFTVNLIDQRLIISGKRPRPNLTEPIAYHQLEVQYGEFRTEISVPWPVDRENVTAAYEDGFLRVDLPRQKQSHTIRVGDTPNDENE